MDPVDDIINRFDALNDSRNLSLEVEDKGNEEELCDEEGDWEEEGDDSEDNYYNYKKSYFPSGNYRNKLMLSEWMLEIPEDFERDWLMIPCPVGKRCLVVSMQGQTRAYSRQGHLIYTFHSALPGGSYQTKYKNNSALLDCIYSDVSQCFYVLDVLSWNRQVMNDTETEFRFFWLATKFLETLNLSEVSRLNPYVFTLLTNYTCEREVIERLMSEPFDYELDGLLFYHKAAHYVRGSTPLAVWLKAYMLPEILDVPVSEKFLALAPMAYAGFAHHADAVRTRKAEWEGKKGGDAGGKGGGAKMEERDGGGNKSDDVSAAAAAEGKEGGKFDGEADVGVKKEEMRVPVQDDVINNVASVIESNGDLDKISKCSAG